MKRGDVKTPDYEKTQMKDMKQEETLHQQSNTEWVESTDIGGGSSHWYNNGMDNA